MNSGGLSNPSAMSCTCSSVNSTRNIDGEHQ
jgi:hypothetical protein